MARVSHLLGKSLLPSVIISLVGLQLPAQSITVGKGTIHPASCLSSSARFITLKGGDRIFGFFQGPEAIELVSTGAGESGFKIEFDYPNDGPNDDIFKTQDEFLDFQFFFKDDFAAQQDVRLHLCFVDRSGVIHPLDRQLADLRQKKLVDFNIFHRAQLNWRDISEFRADKMKLLSVSFNLGVPGNFTFGNNILQLNSPRDISASVMGLKTFDCTILRSCDPVE